MSSSTLMRRQQDKLMERLKVLRKLKENRKCFECHSKSPSCVDTTHNTFVCMTCGGILRIFNFRIKSISISSFTTMEVENLEAGGNRVAKKLWMARFGADEKIPTSGNTEEIKEFVRRKYEERAWVGRVKKKHKEKEQRTKSKRRGKESESDSEESDEPEREVTRRASRTRRQTKEKVKVVDDLLDLNAMFGGASVSAPATAPSAASSVPAASSEDMWSFAASASVQAPDPVSAPTSEQWGYAQGSPQHQQQQQQQQQWMQQQQHVDVQPGSAPLTQEDPFANLLSDGTSTANPFDSSLEADNPFSGSSPTAAAAVNPFGNSPELLRQKSAPLSQEQQYYYQQQQQQQQQQRQMYDQAQTQAQFYAPYYPQQQQAAYVQQQYYQPQQPPPQQLPQQQPQQQQGRLQQDDNPFL